MKGFTNPAQIPILRPTQLIRTIAAARELYWTSKSSASQFSAEAVSTILKMGQTASAPSQSLPSSSAASAACPVDHSKLAPQTTSPAKCPVPHDPPAKCPVPHDQPAKCPVDHDKLNPLNQMPHLSQAPADQQTIALPTARTESSIPRDSGSKWDYPSPQQFYNALVRKGWETPEEHIETVVEIHNFLNERAWDEVLKWEKRVYPYVAFP